MLFTAKSGTRPIGAQRAGPQKRTVRQASAEKQDGLNWGRGHPLRPEIDGTSETGPMQNGVLLMADSAGGTSSLQKAHKRKRKTLVCSSSSHGPAIPQLGTTAAGLDTEGEQIEAKANTKPQKPSTTRPPTRTDASSRRKNSMTDGETSQTKQPQQQCSPKRELQAQPQPLASKKPARPAPRQSQCAQEPEVPFPHVLLHARLEAEISVLAQSLVLEEEEVEQPASRDDAQEAGDELTEEADALSDLSTFQKLCRRRKTARRCGYPLVEQKQRVGVQAGGGNQSPQTRQMAEFGSSAPCRSAGGPAEVVPKLHIHTNFAKQTHMIANSREREWREELAQEDQDLEEGESLEAKGKLELTL
ncbi:hypothetical protein Esti_001115 [Eimeria stiedai]